MEIRIVVPTAPAPSASTTVPKPPQPNQKVLGANVPKAPRKDLQVDAAAKASVKAPQAPPIPKIRADLRFDESINRVVGRIVDESTGKEIREMPPEELRRLYAKTRAMLGPLVDEKV